MKQNQENIIKSPNTIDNNSSTISTTLKPQDDYSSTKHRHSPQCLNMCIKWKLFANLKHETGTYSYVYHIKLIYSFISHSQPTVFSLSDLRRVY